MSSSPLVSVIIPTYNAAALLSETLKTVFAQTFEDFEIIVIDDGSSDGTAAMLATNTDRRLRIISQPNAGIGAARNRGIDEAKGKYVAPLDHDDLWFPKKLQTQVEFLERRPEFVSVGAPYASSSQADKPLFNPADVVDDRGEVQHTLRLIANASYVMLTSFLMFVRGKASGLRYATRRGAIEDVPFQVKLLARGPFGMAGDQLLGVYREHESNASKGSDYFYAGLKQLRQMDHDGLFSDVTGTLRDDMEFYFAQQGRMTAMRQLSMGWRRRAMEIYGREWRHQAEQGRWKFLLSFPLLCALPIAVSRRLEPTAGEAASS